MSPAPHQAKRSQITHCAVVVEKKAVAAKKEASAKIKPVAIIKVIKVDDSSDEDFAAMPAAKKKVTKIMKIMDSSSDDEDIINVEEPKKPKIIVKNSSNNGESKKPIKTTITKQVKKTIDSSSDTEENIQPTKLPMKTQPSPGLGMAKPKVINTMPKWNPPAKAAAAVGTSSKISPSTSLSNLNISPGFRVGLSRNVKGKSLHPNVKMIQK